MSSLIQEINHYPKESVYSQFFRIGFLDDAALVSYAIRLVDKELCRYLQWKDNTVASDEETKV